MSATPRISRPRDPSTGCWNAPRSPRCWPGTGNPPRYVLHTNLLGTINCLEHARTHRAGVILLSSSRVYPVPALQSLRLREASSRFELEDGQNLPGIGSQGINERFPMEGYRTMYGATKLASELLMAEYAAMYGVPGVVNRCGIIAGPWQMGKVDQGVVTLWVARHMYGGSLSYIGFQGSGKQVRDMVHVRDLYRLVSMQLQDLGTYSGGVFNVGGGPEGSVSLCELTALCEQTTGRRIPIAAVPETRPGDIPWYITDCGKITACSGWRPRLTPQDIVADIAAWIEEHRDALRPVLG